MGDDDESKQDDIGDDSAEAEPPESHGAESGKTEGKGPKDGWDSCRRWRR